MNINVFSYCTICSKFDQRNIFHVNSWPINVFVTCLCCSLGAMYGWRGLRTMAGLLTAEQTGNVNNSNRGIKYWNARIVVYKCNNDYGGVRGYCMILLCMADKWFLLFRCWEGQEFPHSCSLLLYHFSVIVMLTRVFVHLVLM